MHAAGVDAAMVARSWAVWVRVLEGRMVLENDTLVRCM
jgi:hypothetical protein